MARFILGVSLILVVCLGASLHVAAEEIDAEEIVRNPVIGNYKGYAEFKMARYGSARAIWEVLDRHDYAEGAFNLGILYEDGLGVEKDLSRALGYYRRAAELGSTRAAFRLGMMYWRGTPDLARDEALGRKYFSLAAARGDQEAAGYLRDGQALEKVDVAEADGRYTDAAALLLDAARGGDSRAQTRIAWYYESGRGVSRDLAQAAHWFTQAARAGDGEAMYALAVMYRTGTGQPLDPEEGRQWLRRSAAAGYPQAKIEIQSE